LATNALEPDELVAPEAAPLAAPVGSGRGVGPLVAVASPAVAAAVAFAVHFLMPNGQIVPMGWMDALPSWAHPYPLVLAALFVGSIGLAAAQWAWRPLSPWVRHFGPLVTGAIAIVTVWELITMKLAWMPLPYFPGPDDVLGALVEDYEVLLNSTWHSLRLLLCGYLAGVAIGLVNGVLIGWFRLVRYWGMPVLKLVGPIPATALVPLVMVISSKSFVGGAALIAYAVMFPVTMLTASGIANVRLSYLDMAKTLGAGRLYLIFRVAIPSALPNVFIGLFIGLIVSFLTLSVAETIGVEAGWGWYIGWKKGYAEYAKVYACLLIMAAFCSTLMTLLFRFRDGVLKWQKGVIRW
jgi:NitT/TauT family transport system permease protein